MKRDPGQGISPGSRFCLCTFLLVVIAYVQTVDPRDLSCPFLRSRRRVLQLLFGPLLGSGYYHLLSGLYFLFAFGRVASPPLAHRGRPSCRLARSALVSFVRLIGCVRALRADARARWWDETTAETITHGDGSSVVWARH